MRSHVRLRSVLVPVASAVVLLGCANPPGAPRTAAGTTMSMGSVNGSTAMAGTTTPSGATTCNVRDWKEGDPYRAGNLVRYQGKVYVAKEDNPGYIPTVSTYFWAPGSC